MIKILQIVLILLLLTILLLIPTGIWYMFDDRLADHFSNPDIGNIPFWTMFMLTMFIKYASSINVSTKGD